MCKDYKCIYCPSFNCKKWKSRISLFLYIPILFKRVKYTLTKKYRNAITKLHNFKVGVSVLLYNKKIIIKKRIIEYKLKKVLEDPIFKRYELFRVCRMIGKRIAK